MTQTNGQVPSPPTNQVSKLPAVSGTGSPGSAVATGKHFVFLVVYLAGLSAFGSFVNDMYLPSLPSMTRFFHCSVPVVQLGLTTGMIGLGAGQLFLGPASDKYGRKKLLVISLIAFCIASAISIFSPTIHFFLVCRFFQGLGASGGYFLARSIPADMFSGKMLAKTMAIVGAINGIAPASAPVVGGLVSDHYTWKGVFVVLTAFGILLLLFSPGLKESLPPERRIKGSIWKSFSNYGLLLKNRSYMVHVLLKGSALGLLFAYVSSGPFIFESHFGYSQTGFGCIMGINALFVAAGSMVALRFRYLKDAAFWGGIGVLLSMGVEVYMLFEQSHSFWCYEITMLPALFFMGMIFTTGNTLAMNEGRAMAGDASALLGIAGYVFGAVVSPLVGAGNILHSTAIAYGVLAVVVLVFALWSRRLAPDLNK